MHTLPGSGDGGDASAANGALRFLAKGFKLGEADAAVVVQVDVVEESRDEFQGVFLRRLFVHRVVSAHAAHDDRCDLLGSEQPVPFRQGPYPIHTTTTTFTRAIPSPASLIHRRSGTKQQKHVIFSPLSFIG